MRRIFRITAASLALAMALALRVSSPASALSTVCQLPASVSTMTSAMLAIPNGVGIGFTGVGQLIATLAQAKDSYNQAMMQACSLQSNVGGLMPSATDLTALKNMSTQIQALNSSSNTHLQDGTTAASTILANAPSVNTRIQQCNTANTTAAAGATEAAQLNGACTAVVAQQLQEANLLTVAQAKQKQAEDNNAAVTQQTVLNLEYGSAGSGVDF